MATIFPAPRFTFLYEDHFQKSPSCLNRFIYHAVVDPHLSAAMRKVHIVGLTILAGALCLLTLGLAGLLLDKCVKIYKAQVTIIAQKERPYRRLIDTFNEVVDPDVSKASDVTPKKIEASPSQKVCNEIVRLVEEGPLAAALVMVDLLPSEIQEDLPLVDRYSFGVVNFDIHTYTLIRMAEVVAKKTKTHLQALPLLDQIRIPETKHFLKSHFLAQHGVVDEAKFEADKITNESLRYAAYAVVAYFRYDFPVAFESVSCFVSDLRVKALLLIYLFAEMDESLTDLQSKVQEELRPFLAGERGEALQRLRDNITFDYTRCQEIIQLAKRGKTDEALLAVKSLPCLPYNTPPPLDTYSFGIINFDIPTYMLLQIADEVMRESVDVEKALLIFDEISDEDTKKVLKSHFLAEQKQPERAKTEAEGIENESLRAAAHAVCSYFLGYLEAAFEGVKGFVTDQRAKARLLIYLFSHMKPEFKHLEAPVLELLRPFLEGEEGEVLRKLKELVSFSSEEVTRRTPYRTPRGRVSSLGEGDPMGAPDSDNKPPSLDVDVTNT